MQGNPKKFVDSKFYTTEIPCQWNSIVSGIPDSLS